MTSSSSTANAFISSSFPDLSNTLSSSLPNSYEKNLKETVITKETLVSADWETNKKIEHLRKPNSEYAKTDGQFKHHHEGKYIFI